MACGEGVQKFLSRPAPRPVLEEGPPKSPCRTRASPEPRTECRVQSLQVRHPPPNRFLFVRALLRNLALGLSQAHGGRASVSVSIELVPSSPTEDANGQSQNPPEQMLEDPAPDVLQIWWLMSMRHLHDASVESHECFKCKANGNGAEHCWVGPTNERGRGRGRQHFRMIRLRAGARARAQQRRNMTQAAQVRSAARAAA